MVSKVRGVGRPGIRFTTRKRGESYSSLREAAKTAGIPYNTFYARVRAGWTPSKVLKTPVRPYERGESPTT